jgi:hypothetical protein
MVTNKARYNLFKVLEVKGHSISLGVVCLGWGSCIVQGVGACQSMATASKAFSCFQALSHDDSSVVVLPGSPK